MSNHETTSENKYRTPAKKKLPPKGTAARALFAAGLWSHMGRDEIERVKKEIFSSRKSAE